MNNFSLPNETPVTLHDGSQVSRSFYDRIKLAAEAGIPKMHPDVPTTLRKICGKGMWLTLGKREVPLAGLCGVTMAGNGDLPLTLLDERDGRNARLYVLK
jgi:hypothetical protein